MQISLLTVADRAPATREAALQRLEAFVPRAGRLYAAERNYDRGPAQRSNVSTLSPYLRHRVITEVEVLTQVLGAHSASAAQKFVQEIFWRTYWKGWLEAHPGAWSAYQAGVRARLDELAGRPDLAGAYAAAVAGRTGIDAFDAWAHELVAQNYLHNHARMWFASIWIFTLGLPWELGADFFMRHLLDGDPASNTLSWRWVAGLHTRGRTYLATRENIRRYTDGRFELGTALARSAPAREDLASPRVPQADVPDVAVTDEPSLLVLHEDDVHGDLRSIPIASVRGVCAIRTPAGRSPQALNPAVIAFTDTVMREAVARCAAFTSAHDLGVVVQTEAAPRCVAVAAAARACGATRIIAPFAPVGPARAALAELAAAAHRADLGYVEFGRRYDALAWPSAARGYFNLRSHIPRILSELDIGAG